MGQAVNGDHRFWGQKIRIKGQICYTYGVKKEGHDGISDQTERASEEILALN